jgi:hypothetical protein
VKESHQSDHQIAQSIQPILRAFPNAEIGIIGCHAARISRACCEYDLLILGVERSFESTKVGEVHLDLCFAQQPSATKGGDREFMASLSSLIPIRDNGWELATLVQSAKESINENYRGSTETRLTQALKHLARVNEGVQSKKYVDADFWLLAAGYEFSFATVYATRSTPSPSHILEQMKKVSTSKHYKFREWANSVGLELSSRAACENRIEGLSVLYDFIKSAEVDLTLASSLARYRTDAYFEIVRNKAIYLIDQLQIVDSYTFLGIEVVRTLLDLLAMQATKTGRDIDYSSPITRLTVGNDKIVSEQLVRSLGIQRSAEMIEDATEKLNAAISHQARRV